MSANRLQVFPTRNNLTLMKNRLKSAEKGYSLLKRKSEALQVKHREIGLRLEKEQDDLKVLIRKAYFELAKAEFYGSNTKSFLYECKKCEIEIESSLDQISGILLPVYLFNTEKQSVPFFIDKSGYAYFETRKTFMKVVKRLIEIASLKNSYMILDEVLKNTNRRVNALDLMLIPKITNTINYINSELDEQDREEFFRLKKVQSMKKAECDN